MADDSALGGELTLAIFKLNGQMIAAGESIARPAGITVAWWQVLGAVMHEPQTASGVSRQMGITRQAVQRVANRLIDDGLLESFANPAHKRAPLLSPTAKGLASVQRISPDQTAFSSRIVEAFGRTELEELVAALHALSDVVERTKP